MEIAQRRNTLKMKLEKGKTSGMAINKQIRNKPWNKIKAKLGFHKSKFYIYLELIFDCTPSLKLGKIGNRLKSVFKWKGCK